MAVLMEEKRVVLMVAMVALKAASKVAKWVETKAGGRAASMVEKMVAS